MSGSDASAKAEIAYSIGGDMYGLLAEFLQAKNPPSDGSIGFSPGQSVQIPNPILTGFEHVIFSFSDSPATFVNAWGFLTVTLPFVFVFFAAKKLLQGRMGGASLALIAATSIAFSAFNVWHFLAGHGFNLFFLLLWLWLHFRLCYSPNFAKSLIAGVALGVNAVFSPYLGFFSGLVAVVSVGVIMPRRSQDAVSLVFFNLLSWLIGIGITVAFVFPVIGEIIGAHSQQVGSAFNRDPGGVWGVVPWMYLLPPPSHLLVGHGYAELYRQWMLIGNVPENAVYLGAFNIVFFAYGIYLYFWKKIGGVDRNAFLVVSILASFCFLVSLPPYVPLPNGERVHLAGYYLQQMFPMFRIYGRAGILVLVFVTTGAVIAFHHLLEHQKKGAGSLVCGALLLVLIDLAPRLPTLDFAKHPEVYDWLKAKPGHFAIYELPEDGSLAGRDDFQFYRRRYFQMVHGKKLANRSIRAPDLQSRLFYEELKSQGVEYLIQHISMYREGPVPNEYKPYVSTKAAQERFNNGVVEELPSWYLPEARVADATIYRVQ